MTATEQRVRESKEETVYIMDEKLQKLMNMVNNVVSLGKNPTWNF